MTPLFSIFSITKLFPKKPVDKDRDEVHTAGHIEVYGVEYMNTETLGSFEQVVLTAVAGLDDAYGVSIRLKVEEIMGKEVRFSSVYTTLDRMEDKGYLTSWMSDPTPERGGRRKRCYKLERAGKAALREAIQSAARMLEVAKGRI